MSWRALTTSSTLVDDMASLLCQLLCEIFAVSSLAHSDTLAHMNGSYWCPGIPRTSTLPKEKRSVSKTARNMN